MTATALDNLSAVDGSSALDTVAISLSSDQREQIEQNLQAFADAGAQVSFAVADLGSGGVIAANRRRGAVPGVVDQGAVHRVAAAGGRSESG